MTNDDPQVVAGQLWRERVTDRAFIPLDKTINQEYWIEAHGSRVSENDLMDENKWVLVRSDDDRIVDWWEDLSTEQRAAASDITGTIAPPWLVVSLTQAKVFVPGTQWANTDGYEFRIPPPVQEFLAAHRG